jgi:hypothetical protein
MTFKKASLHKHFTTYKASPEKLQVIVPVSTDTLVISHVQY